jgi:uncharacterized protein
MWQPKRAVAQYVVSVLATSWIAGASLFGAKQVRGEAIRPWSVLTMFPFLVVSVAAFAVALTWLRDGPGDLRALFAEIRLTRDRLAWLAVTLVPPALILFVLELLARVSSVFVPNLFLVGVLFGVFPGLVEEIGWTGFAFRRLTTTTSALKAALTLGLVWAIWHLPVVDSLGAAVPHGSAWLPFVVAFSAMVTAMRVLIAWVYANTRSLLLAQLLHASSTASLVVFGPPHVSPAQEALWYGLYAVSLWIVVSGVVLRFGTDLVRGPRPVAL